MCRLTVDFINCYVFNGIFQLYFILHQGGHYTYPYFPWGGGGFVLPFLLKTFLCRLLFPHNPGRNNLQKLFNPLPYMPILGYSNSAANKDMMSKTLTDGDTIF